MLAVPAAVEPLLIWRWCFVGSQHLPGILSLARHLTAAAAAAAAGGGGGGGRCLAQRRHRLLSHPMPVAPCAAESDWGWEQYGADCSDLSIVQISKDAGRNLQHCTVMCMHHHC